MKKKLFIGLGLFGIAFTGAAFTANRALEENHYIQLDNSCEAIPLTMCVPGAETPCQEWDGSQMRDVYESPGDNVTCQTQLFEP